MKTNRTEKGQALILIVFGIIALIALTGLAVDASIAYSNRRGAQNASDTAALSGALDIANNNSSSITTDAGTAASADGFTDDGGVTTKITVNNPPAAGCNGTTPTFSNPSSQYVQVIIRTNVKTSFASIVGANQTHNCVEAIARGQSSVSGSMFNGAAVVATDNVNGCSQTILLNSSATITTTGGGVFDNCGGSSALMINSSAKITSPSNVQVVGGYTNNGGTISPGITTGATGITMPLAAWSSIPAIPAAPTCSGAGTVNPSSDLSGGSVTVNSGTATLYPGNFTNITVGSSSSAVFSPGTYCISGSVNLNSSSSMTGTSGTVNIVMAGGLTLNSSVTANFSDLEIWTTNGNWILNSSATMTATKLRFYSSGSSTFTVNSSSTLTSSNAVFYLTSGSVTWNSSSTLSIAAPPTGDPFAGLAIYMPWGNTSPLNINSSSSVNVTGTILAPQSPITLNSSGSANILNSQIVGYTFTVNSSAALKVNFNAGQNYGTPQNAVVELVK